MNEGEDDMDVGEVGGGRKRGQREECLMEEASRMLGEMEDMVVDVLIKAKVKKEYRETLVAGLRNLKDVFVEIELESAEMRGRLRERGVIVDEIRKMRREEKDGNEGEVGSYAGAVKRDGGRSCGAGVERGRGKLEVVVTMEGKDSEEVRREIMKENPKELGVNVERLIKTRKGLVVEMTTKNEVERMMNSESLRRKGYVVREGVKKRPTVMIYDLEKGPEEEILKEMYMRNFSESMTEQEFLRAVKVRRKIGQKKGGREKEKVERETWIMEVSGRIYEGCMRQERVYMKWEAVRVKEYVDIVRCFKCQGFGHIGKVCRERKQVCERCGEDHKTEACGVSDTEVKCPNCAREGRETCHAACWKGCEIYRRAEERYFKAVDYES